MNKVSQKIFASLLVIMLLGANLSGLGYNISLALSNNELTSQTETNKELNTELVGSLTKYVPYKLDEKYGVMLQTKLEASTKENSLPVNKITINSQMPQIAEKVPSFVSVIKEGANDGVDFGKDNYTYDAETGKLTISVENKQEEAKEIKDIYLVTAYFEGKEAYEAVEKDGIDAKIPVNALVEAKNDISKASKIDIEAKTEEAVGEMTDVLVYSPSKIDKGQVYANYDAKNKVEVPYSLTYGTNIYNANYTDKIEFVQAVDKFVTKDEKNAYTTVSDKNYTYNKKISVNKLVFEKMLGEDGVIDILNSKDEKIATINKETAVENENYILDISKQDNNQLKIVTSKPISEGSFEINIEKAIKTKMDYSKNQVKTFEKMVTGLEMGEKALEKEIKLEDPKSSANISVSHKDLTTVVKNENVIITAILDTSSTSNALFKDPTLKIKLPKYISNIELNKYDIVMANGLKLKAKPTIKKEKDQLVINIELEGTQTEYTVGADYEGTNIVLDTNLVVDTLAPTNKNKIEMEYTNENTILEETKGVAQAELNFVAPIGVVTANGISNYAAKNSNILSISNKEVVGELETFAEAKTATIYGKIVNNYENSVNNVVVLGRIPAKGNENIDSEESLDSTFDTLFVGDVVLKGVNKEEYTVYYSNKTDATTELENSENNWSKTRTKDSKSYLIVINNHEIKPGEMVEFSYNVQIPAKLKYNSNAAEMYKVYYNNTSKIGTMLETKTSPIMRLSTPKGPELSTKIESTAQTVREGQIVKMKVSVTNTGSEAAEDIVVKIPVPEHAKFAEYLQGTSFSIVDDKTKEISLETIPAGKTKVASYYIKMDDDTVYVPTSITTDENGEQHISPEDSEKLQKSLIYPKEIVHKAELSAKGLVGTMPITEYKMNLEKGQIAIELTSSESEEYPLQVGNEIIYRMYLRNVSQAGDLQNTVLTMKLPKGISYKSGEMRDDWDETEGKTEGITYNKENNTVTMNIGTVQVQKIAVLTVEVESKQNDNISMIATATADGMDTNYSNIVEYSVEKAELKLSELVSSPHYVKEEEYYTYSLDITNEGTVSAHNIEIATALPKEVQVAEATYTLQNENRIMSMIHGEEKTIFSITEIPENCTVNVKIKVKAGGIESKTEKQVQTKMTVSALNIGAMDTNTVTNIIEYNEKVHEGTSSGGSTSSPEARYKISGTAWEDTNKNGKRDSDEPLLSNVGVMLIDKQTNKIVKDPDTKLEKNIITNENGQYTFDNISAGKYLVVFRYEAAKYSLTTYQAQDVDSSLNSDAINLNLTIDGVREIAATSDVITVSNDNVRDIDIGLYASEKFDLRLDKYISKITLTTPTIGTTTYQYNDSKVAKVEVLGSSLGKSNMVIEYKLRITNEGAVAGYARKIVDYLPQDVSFNTELNKDWYLLEDGNLYNASLANTLIEPGQSKELTLIVTKKITKDSLGTNYTNNAEIYESYNEKGLDDMDSKPGNIMLEEDDMSQAEFIISIVTGKIVTYTVITLVVVAMLAFGVYEIKKRVFVKNK